MSAWPGSPGFVTTNLDDATDNPSAARVDLKNALDDVSDMIGARGSASGVAPLDSSSKVPLANLPVLPFGNGLAAWQTAGTFSWTVPAGVTKLYVEAWGGGGGGGYANSTRHGGGGGAGGGAIKLWSVTPGDSVTIVVGSAGQGALGPTDANGADGGNSTVTIGATSISGNGGKGGEGATGFGGYGGTSTGGDVSLEGGTAQSGAQYLGGSGGTNARSGAAPGSGGGFGGGGYGSGTGGSDPAISGRPGGVWIQY